MLTTICRGPVSAWGSLQFILSFNFVASQPSVRDCMWTRDQPTLLAALVRGKRIMFCLFACMVHCLRVLSTVWYCMSTVLLALYEAPSWTPLVCLHQRSWLLSRQPAHIHGGTVSSNHSKLLCWFHWASMKTFFVKGAAWVARKKREALSVQRQAIISHCLHMPAL